VDKAGDSVKEKLELLDTGNLILKKDYMIDFQESVISFNLLVHLMTKNYALKFSILKTKNF